ncbi:putative transcriptional regulatory protein, AraC family; putative eutR-like [Bradyrhizobium sp. ORS 278]|uniref:helix-turn-helix domain-containing protein n=1 Tax=Bradyrhizobium sp. (strain ORS 278) TaxID=114615 RepID=UPI0001508A17|nr:helix-turn-helix domain-containing protein [Bradyrhizobium sp. ORS 278]CAL80137.1 putative transcriptional regulatory protein, AraC family; putative eutR-like [Bradyrhizobium sp. ORS 278]
MTRTPPNPADRPALVQTHSTDVDEHCAQLGGWQLAYDQISAGAFRGSFTQVSLSRLDVFREVTSQQVRQYGQLGRDCFGLAVPCGGEGPVNVNGTSITQDALIISFDADVDICTPRRFQLRGVTLPTAVIEDIACQLGIELPRGLKHRMSALSASPSLLARLRAALAAIDAALGDGTPLADDPAGAEALQDSLLLEIADLLPNLAPAKDTRSAADRKRIVDQACAMMLADAETPVSMLDICKAVGASRRKLSYCFQDVLGTSPIPYWRAVRLNRVRRDLKSNQDPRDGIYDVAVRHGFWHFSQFSLDYKRHFAELPSETLRRARMDASIALRHNSPRH